MEEGPGSEAVGELWQAVRWGNGGGCQRRRGGGDGGEVAVYIFVSKYV